MGVDLPSPQDLTEIDKGLKSRDAEATRNREMMGRLKEMGEQGFRNLSSKLADRIAMIGTKLDPERVQIRYNGATSADDQRREAREAIEALSSFHSDVEPFDDGVENIYGSSGIGRFGTPSGKGMVIRAFHQPEREGAHAMIQEYKIPYAVWEAVAQYRGEGALQEQDGEDLRLITLKQEAEAALHQQHLINSRLESLSLNPNGGDSIFEELKPEAEAATE